ncbi:MAG: hypothetical protein MJZ01_07720 [Bacteroidales bacterium]|nr:hypothetical protein [Bacteroidales bacterium]
MKNILITFSLSVILISAIASYDMFGKVNTKSVDCVDLSVDNGQLHDMVFDANGNLLSETTYAWNNEKDCRGDVISSNIYNMD